MSRSVWTDNVRPGACRAPGPIYRQNDRGKYRQNIRQIADRFEATPKGGGEASNMQRSRLKKGVTLA
jgi:hypothetical protein